LPAEKQYLVTIGIPCSQRVKDLQKLHQTNGSEFEVECEDGWTETLNPDKKGGEKHNEDDDLFDEDDEPQVI